MIRIPFLADRVHLPLRSYASARLLPCVAALSVYLAALAGVGLIAVATQMPVSTLLAVVTLSTAWPAGSC